MPTPTTFGGLVDSLLGLIGQAVPVLFAVVFVFLVWKIFDSWVINAGDEKKREEGKQYAMTAVLVFIMMLIVWGVVRMLRSSIFGI
jgi:magnesium-transporting ATPase (P-type)